MQFLYLEISKPTSEPPRKRDVSGFPKKYPGVWQSLHPPSVTRYLPRVICASSVMAVDTGSAITDAVKNARRTGEKLGADSAAMNTIL